MDVRAQVSMVFHLDKCIGCHTCSIACKNVWTDRRGAEYMWWNNVETKPGTGFPTRWEDQSKYQGGWERKNGKVHLRAISKGSSIANIFHNPNLPTIDDYYEPWTYRYEDLFNAPEGPDQPTARAISQLTGQPMNIEAGPNWDDDLSGSPVYAENDVNLEGLSDLEREALFEAERMVFFYVPRICNHCTNPACVAACPSGALYKRGEDGIVLLNQERCRAWRFCVTACPYKKTYFNWSTGKSEKCILCYPRVETGEAPACFHSCVGRIRYMGVVLYDAEQITAAINVSDSELVNAQKRMILDPRDPDVQREARENGIAESTIEYAQKSPVWQFLKEWNLALPLHPEYRTLPMLFYVPPLLPVMASVTDGVYDTTTSSIFGTLDDARLPMKYLARLFAAGNEGHVRYSLKKQMAVRLFKRQQAVGDLDPEIVARAMSEADTNEQEMEAIYRLTSLPLFDQRFVIPPSHREEVIESLDDAGVYKGMSGFGPRVEPRRGL